MPKQANRYASLQKLQYCSFGCEKDGTDRLMITIICFKAVLPCHAMKASAPVLAFDRLELFQPVQVSFLSMTFGSGFVMYWKWLLECKRCQVYLKFEVEWPSGEEFVVNTLGLSVEDRYLKSRFSFSKEHSNFKGLSL